MAQQLGALTFFPVYLGLVPSTRTRQLTTAYSFIFREANVLSWPLQVLHTYGEHTYPQAHIHVHTCTQRE